MDDPNLTETVVLIVHHSDEGSFGLFLNRPTWVDGAEAFGALDGFDEATRTLDYGGPVAITQLLALTSSRGGTENATEVTDGVYLTADLAALAPAGGDADVTSRVFAGHYVWPPDQLDQEVEDGFWRVTDSNRTLIFESEADGFWQRIWEISGEGLTAAVTLAR